LLGTLPFFRFSGFNSGFEPVVAGGFSSALHDDAVRRGGAARVPGDAARRCMMMQYRAGARRGYRGIQLGAA